jgi:hypothetical protein
MANKAVQLDTFNFFLIIVSLVTAIYFPFELFILAYAILGPLHYVTEINWLEKKNFFIRKRPQIWLIIALTLLIAIPFTIIAIPDFNESLGEDNFLRDLKSHSATFCLTAIFTALALVLSENWKVAVAVFTISLLSGYFLEGFRSFGIVIGGLIPTIIHVYVFTILFMLYGAMKSKSKIGYFTVLMMFIVPIVIYYLPVSSRGFEVGDYYRNTYDTSRFTNLNYSLAWAIGVFEDRPNYTLLSEIGIKLQIFIAFAYTYHYLNWFSKTTVIGWHKHISKKKLVLLLSIWVIAVTVYFINYFAGFLLLLFLSYLHVLLEFPLNVFSVKEIGKGILDGVKRT